MEHYNRRNTTQRETILEELKKLDTHPTADDIYSVVREQLPRISMGTIYRNLEILAKSGFIKRFPVDGIMRFDAKLNKHYHIRCTKCGKLEDVELEIEEQLEHIASNQTDFQIKGFKLEFSGICPDCKESEQTEH